MATDCARFSDMNSGFVGTVRIASQRMTSSFVTPVRSAPKRTPQRRSACTSTASSPTASSGVRTRLDIRRSRPVVTTTKPRSATASSVRSKTLAFLRMSIAPTAMMLAFSLGQPSRGLTRRRSDRPKLSITRAAAPMFSPNCGCDRMIAGPAIRAAPQPCAARSRGLNSLRNSSLKRNRET